MPGTGTLSLYDEDFAFLKACRECLINETERYESTEDNEKRVKEGYYTKMSNGCSVRLVLPHGGDIVRELQNKSEERDCVLYFVGFIGFTWEGVLESVKKKVWGWDRLLTQELARHEDIVAYVSAERSPGGHWGNFVVFRHPDAVTKWQKADIHDKAVTDISPRLYSHVRIHRGRLEKGLFSEKFGVERTLFVKYDNEKNGLESRQVNTWSQDKCTSIDHCYVV